MSKRDNRLLVEDILEASQKIKRYTDGCTYETFLKDEKTADAVVRNFEIIGEAANRVDPDFKLIHPEIEWRQLADFRNRLIHEYFGVDYEIVWEIISENLDSLIDFLENIVSE